MDFKGIYNGLSPEKRKFAALLIVLALVIVFLRMPSPSELRRFFPSVTPVWQGKPSPFDGRLNVAPPTVLTRRAGVTPRQAPVPNVPPPAIRGYVPPVESAGAPVPESLLGSWAGRSLLPRRGMCTLSVELKMQSVEASAVVAYTTLQCMNPSLLARGGPVGARSGTPEAAMAAAASLMPVSFIFSGASEDGSVIKLHVDKTIGAGEGCTVESATVTPFGTNQIGFAIEDSCGGGEMLLRKGWQ